MIDHVPGKRRANLDLRWAPGTYLGTVLNTNEVWIGMPNGNVTRARAVCRVSEERRWNRDAIQQLVGTPMHPNPLDDAYDHPDDVEATYTPHAGLDSELRQDFQQEEQHGARREEGRLRITRADLQK